MHIFRRAISLLLVFSMIVSFIVGTNAYAVPAHAANVTVQQVYYVNPDKDSGGDGSQANPFHKIEEARNAVRKINSNMTGDIIVYLEGGTYYLDSSITFGKEDSGTNGHNIRYEAYQGATPVISGGKVVTGWEKVMDSDAPSPNLWKAHLSRNKKLRALYVNGKRADMTHKDISAKGGYDTYTVKKGQADWAWVDGTASAGVSFNASDMPTALRNPQNIELRTSSRWCQATVCVDHIKPSATDGQNVAYLQMPYGAIAQHISWAPYSTNGNTTVFNVYEWLKTPGQFYFDQANQTVYYYPREGENMSTANVVEPKLETLIDFQGTPVASGDLTTAGRKNITGQVHNIVFSGLKFMHTDYNLYELDGSHGNATVQAGTVATAFADGNWHHDMYRSYDNLPGAIQMDSVYNIKILNSEVAHTGCQGVVMENDITNCEMTGNYITDTSGTGILIGHPQHLYENDSLEPDKYVYKVNGAACGAGAEKEKFKNGTEAVPTNILISNNYLLNTCVLFQGHCPITSFFTNGLTISHNFIYDAPYSGISVGWGWWNFDGSNTDHCILPGLPTNTSKNNKIDYNRVENCIKVLQDAGAIYTLGSQGDSPDKNASEIVGNYLNPLPGATGWAMVNGIHPDEGSAYLKINDNVITNILQHVIELNDWNNKHDDPVNNLYSNSTALATGAPNCPITNFYYDKNSIWDPYGYNIVLNAGLEDQYKSLISKDIIAQTEFEFPSSVRADPQQTLNIGGRFSPEDTVWFAPVGTTDFKESDAMTKASGNSKTIVTPKKNGTYNLFVKYADGTVEVSKNTLTIGDTITNIKDGGKYEASSTNPLVLNLNANYSWTLNDKNVSDGAKITEAGNYTLVATGNFGSKPVVTFHFSVSVNDVNQLLPNSVSVPQGSLITLSKNLNDTQKTIWIAPLNTTKFNANTSTMTSTPGNSTQIKAPMTQGDYYLYIVDKDGSVSVSTAKISVLGGPSYDFSSALIKLESPNGVTKSNNSVSSWTDSVKGYSFSNTDSTKQPQYTTDSNGIPCLSFDGIDDNLVANLDTDYFNNKQNLSMVVVAKDKALKDTTAGTGGDAACPFFVTGGDWGDLYLNPLLSSIQYRFGTGAGWCFTSYSRLKALATGTLSTTVAVKSGTTESLYVDGSPVNTANGKTAATKNITTTGYLGKGNDQFYKGDIYAVYVFDKALTQSDVTNLQKYLNYKFIPENLSAKDIAGGIQSVVDLVADETTLAMPKVPNGFTIAIKSSDSNVIGTDGTITPPNVDTTVNLVYTVTRISDHTTADTACIKVMVPAKSNIPNKTALQTEIATALSLNQSDYTSGSWAGLQTTLQAGQAVAGDEKATQDQVDKALADLQAAVNALIKNSSSGGSSQPKAVVITNPTTGITVSTASGVLPEDSQLIVNILTSGTTFQKVQNALKDVAAKIEVLQLSLQNAGKTIEPDGSVFVTIPIPAGFDKAHLALYYIADDGSRTQIPIQIEENKIVFKTTHFSTYALVQTAAQHSTQSPQTVTQQSPQTGDTQQQPWWIAVCGVLT